RMNMELMQLYKKYGANPFSGCWPMLLQIPIFFALFTTLRNSWDLHGAGFALWIKDLSDKDPYYVLPILMGGLMFLQNYMTPQPTQDQSQAMIMKWMPVIFTFLFLTFPSGLVLYWIVNSIFSMGQNYYLKKTSEI
ncbi:MAG: membrane protein insertase YidC, partial [Elusimicrobiales bacterium]|nr:membrane protein insertase YidC [Elusimicrobiales bacterium]